MDHNNKFCNIPYTVLHWNYRGFTEFPIQRLHGEVTDIYLKENLISYIPKDIGNLIHLESLYLSGNDITELPSAISKLRCLKCLDVSGNRLRNLPDEIGEVESLKFLILDENELRELPLRIAELRSLRYLSVCVMTGHVINVENKYKQRDHITVEVLGKFIINNKLKWLAQRPVYNYHHCEFRFWRNATLKTIPYSLWYHMFRDQQTRSLNIGCLNFQKYQDNSESSRCQLKLNRDSREWNLAVDCPPQHLTILEKDSCSPPSLFEICRRVFYEMISETAKRLSTAPLSVYSDVFNNYNNYEGDMTNIEEIDNVNFHCDENGNSLTYFANDRNSNSNAVDDDKKNRKNGYYIPADIIEEYFSFIPNVIKQDLYNGPVSRCENVKCKRPVFDYVLYEFSLDKITLIDKTEDVILSATFCSKSCANFWKIGKANLLPWTLLKKS